MRVIAFVIGVLQLFMVITTGWFIYTSFKYMGEVYRHGMEGADFLLGFLLLFFLMKMLNTTQTAVSKRVDSE